MKAWLMSLATAALMTATPMTPTSDPTGLPLGKPTRKRPAVTVLHRSARNQ